ncbi:MAG: DUF4919 domain-containing protein [Glaciecola sp.]
MRGFSILLVMLLTGCQSNHPNSESEHAENKSESSRLLNYDKSDADYHSLVNLIREQAATAEDFNRIIKVYPLTSLYQPSNNAEQVSKLQSQTQMQNQQWQACLQTNEALLQQNYTSLTGHYGAAICATELGNIETGQYHNGVLDGLIEAIWRTGDGKTPTTPLYITSANDLYAFVQLHQFVVVGQSLTYVNKLPIQVIKVHNPETNRTMLWYFDVTPQFRRGVITELERSR